ncbi:unnamed protein product [Rotaria socialis]
MIIGMDFINRYNLSIDVKKQLVSIEVRNQRILIPIVNVMKSIKIPVISSNTILLPSNSTRKISVAIPISSISLPFIPTFSFKSHIPVDYKDNTLAFHNYRSDVLLYNAMRHPKVIKKGTRLGYLLCCSTFQHPRMFYSSHYRLHGTTRCTGMNPAFSNSIIKDDFHIRSSALSNNNSTCTNRFIRYSADKLSSSKKVSNSTVTQHLNLLVQNVQNDEHKRDLLALLRQFSNIFDTTRHNVANTPIPHVINTIPHSPPASRPYPQPDKEEIMYQFIQEFLQAGLISESNSPYAAPAILVKKKDNSYRFVVDYKRLNAITIKDSFPLPNMEDTIFKLGKGFSYFSKFDLKSGFYQIPINEADKMKTAFITPFGLYQFNVLPMGLRNSPPTFQKVMTDTLKSCRSFCLVYLDDIIIFSESFSDHLYHLRCVFSALHDKNLLLNPPKCELAVQRINYLGHTIKKDSITPMKDKIEAILRIPEPHTLAQANRFLGSLGWYRKFLPKFADVAAPIHAVTNLTKPNRKKFKWELVQSKAFHQLKHMLITEPLFLHFPIDNSPLILTTDASDTGLGGVLQQKVNGQLHNLYYHSQIMTPCQRKYSTIEKEALAIYRCFDRMRSFILAILSDRGTHFLNTLMENIKNLIGYNHIYSTPYHPQTNGVVERFNATFVAQISKLQNTQHNNWDEYLQAVVFAYNTGVHKSTKFSPYELLYGCAARLPIHSRSQHFTFLKPNDYFEQLKKTLRVFHQASRENILLQQQANQEYYNKNRLDPQLKLGDKVLRRIYISKGKLDPKFSPIPNIVVELHHPMYVVEDEYTGIRSQVHISDLRPLIST